MHFSVTHRVTVTLDKVEGKLGTHPASENNEGNDGEREECADDKLVRATFQKCSSPISKTPCCCILHGCCRSILHHSCRSILGCRQPVGQRWKSAQLLPLLRPHAYLATKRSAA